MRTTSTLIAATTAALLATAGNAAIFKAEWSGEEEGNSAMITGYFDIDVGAVDGGPFFVSSGDGPVVAILGVVVSGASSGNGVFGPTVFEDYYFSSPADLDFSTELYGQDLGNGCFFGERGACGGGNGGDFNIFDFTGNGPLGVYFFELATNGGTGDLTFLTSLAPHSGPVPDFPVPAPGALGLLGLGLLGTAAVRRRRA